MKKIFALGLAMMLCAASMTAQAACACDGWNPLPEGTLPAGNYCLGQGTYVDGNRMLADRSKVQICLHGKTLTGQITVAEGEELHLYDCKGNGSISSGYTAIDVKKGGVFVLHGGTLISTKESTGEDACINNNGTVKILGGNVESAGCGLRNLGSVEIDGGKVSGNMMGVYNHKDLTINGGVIHGGLFGVVLQEWPDEDEGVDYIPSLTIKKGKISNEVEELEGMPLSAVMAAQEDESFAPLDEEECIAEGSYIAEGALDKSYVRVERIPAAGGAAALPQTGDASMLGAWVCLLGAAGMGLKLKKH